MNVNLELAQTYAPYIYFDRLEPFFPVRVGVTVLDREGESPSFRRTFSFDDPALQYVIEYAIYWDFDIGHLYELEHVWIYVGKNGEVLDCDASFHGKYFKGLLKDRSNLLDGTHVKLYSQPGKHAFMPKADMFELIPGLTTCTYEGAGKAGLIITRPFDGVYTTDEETNRLVERYLQQFKFRPSFEFEEYRIPKELFVSWPELHREVPRRIEARLAEMRSQLGEA